MQLPDESNELSTVETVVLNSCESIGLSVSIKCFSFLYGRIHSFVEVKMQWINSAWTFNLLFCLGL